MSIEVNNLTKIYGAQKAVDGISFSIQKGEIVGFLGPNGAGKSTTMKMITGYLQPDSGYALVSGIPVTSKPIEVKQRVGYLPEANALYYDMYVREYLQFIAEIHQVKHARKRIEEMITLTGLTVESNKKTGQLSKGYKQRVGLAAALIHDPEVLILDEPTSGLDPNQIIEIREVIRRQGKEKTILFSSHILQEVTAICDRVIIINHGKIVADDQLSKLQNMNESSHLVIVHFKETVDQHLLYTIKEVESVQNLQPGLFKLTTQQPDSVKKQLLELSLHHDYNIVSLQTESQSLEEVFRSLTQTNASLKTI
ncbi:MAG: gliding motility-associated ABC transporter ATP-binding subunit GldA [Chitinophagaceae bacterium]|jgi:ABC-2 type transport system ATP-binding protein|nr:gliding motility-associated ABC transporter ATP-binding subunit GldA [Chitinophagaceae bacterium]